MCAEGRIFKWPFLKAAVAFPLIGTDFLVNFGLSVDLAAMTLRAAGSAAIALSSPPAGKVFATVGVQPQRAVGPHLAGCSTSSSPASPSLVDGPEAAAVAHLVTPDYAALLAKFSDVVNSSKQLPPVKHKVEHHIITTGRPVSARYRRLDPERLAAAKAEFAELERQGVVRRSDSEWASPLHMVKKAGGGWRPCGDFRQLNLQTTPDRYTCPNIGDLAASLAGCTVFSKLDLRKGYHQIPVRPADVRKTAIITPFGLYEFRRVAFGLRNAGQTFQRMMDQVLAGLDFCFVYLDDILVASSGHEQHVEHLELVLERLQSHGLVLNAEKCELGAAEVDYLGHRISAGGVRPLAAKTAAIKNFQRPTTARGLQTYLGMVNFYRRFLKDAALILKPLTDALKGRAKGQLEWSAEMVAAFEKSKGAMLNAAELAHPERGAELELAVDASGSHCGAVLHQRPAGGSWRIFP